MRRIPTGNSRAPTWRADLSRYTLTLPARPAGQLVAIRPDIEVMVAGNWEINRLPVQIARSGHGRRRAGPAARPGPRGDPPRTGPLVPLRERPGNARSAGRVVLGPPTGTLRYWPLPGEDLAAAEVIAPVLPATGRGEGHGRAAGAESAFPRPAVRAHGSAPACRAATWASKPATARRARTGRTPGAACRPRSAGTTWSSRAWTTACWRTSAAAASSWSPAATTT